MQDLVAIVVSLLLVAAAATMLLSSFEIERLFNALRERHFQAWLDLGAPGPYGQGMATPSGLNSPATRFVLGRGYLAIPDKDLHLLGYRARRMVLVSFWALGALMVSFVFIAVAS